MTRTAALAAAALLAVAPVSAAGQTDGNVAAPMQTVSTLVRGQPVTIAGVVDRITDEDEFVLRDATGTVRVYVGPNFVPAPEGESVTVSGRVDDGLRLEIYATAILRADGTLVELSHRY
jgi:uncharacterized protein YdeI (BOF family)